MNKFLKEFKDRGYFYQCTNEEDLSKLLEKEKIKGYIGFDCTAESLHVGSLLQIMCLRFQCIVTTLYLILLLFSMDLLNINCHSTHHYSIFYLHKWFPIGLCINSRYTQ